MIKAIIFDYGRTLYDRESDDFFPEVSDLLQQLSQKYKLAIVSIAGIKDPPKSRRRTLKDAKFDIHFSSTLFHAKSKDNLFSETLKRLQVLPKEVVIVDDRVARGINWGNKNGAITIWLRKGKFKDELPSEDTGEPTHIIEDLSELFHLL